MAGAPRWPAALHTRPAGLAGWDGPL